MENQNNTTAVGKMETAETRQLIEAYYKALTSGDRAGVLALVADECRWVPPSTVPFGVMDGGPTIVAEITGDMPKRIFDMSKPFVLEVRSMIVDGDTAAVQQRLTATTKDSGEHYENEYVWVYTCREGKIVHMEEYADTLMASRVMGW